MCNMGSLKILTLACICITNILNKDQHIVFNKCFLMNDYISYVVKCYPTEAPNQVLKDHGELPEDICKLRFEVEL